MSQNNERPSRRQLLKSVPLAAGASLLAGAARAAEPTPADAEGPFYPIIDNDLTFVGRLGQPSFFGRRTDESGRDLSRAVGDVIYVHGRVTDTDGNPVADVLVDVWQADHQGIYSHSGDPRAADRDPNLQGNGHSVTDDDGRYRFKTIKPRFYGEETFLRAPHIHFRIARRGYHELITQMYFSGEETNARDGLYNQHSPAEQALLTVTLKPVESLPSEVAEVCKREFHEKELVTNSRHGQFDIVIQAV